MKNITKTHLSNRAISRSDSRDCRDAKASIIFPAWNNHYHIIAHAASLSPSEITAVPSPDVIRGESGQHEDILELSPKQQIKPKRNFKEHEIFRFIQDD
jgi:hypothetical protein